MKTEIVFVCSKNFKRYLFLSLRTLFWSNPDIERVRVYVVSDRLPRWKITDSRVVIEAVPDIGVKGPWGYYWGNNKLHLCRSNADRVIYLDTDVMVLSPLESVYRDHKEDLLARYAVATYMTHGFNPEMWERMLQQAEVSHDYPFYSPGFIVFQNGAHKKIEKSWNRYISLILGGNIPVKALKHAELYAFSLAAARLNLTHEVMSDHHHRYAMIGEKYDDATVFHLGTPGFYRHYLCVEKELGLKHKKNLLVNRPKFTSAHAIYVRAKHRLLDMIRRGRREERVKY